MEKQYGFILTNRPLLFLLLVGGLLSVMFGLKALDEIAKTFAIGKDVRMIGFLFLLAGGFYGVYQLAKKVAGKPVQVAIESDRLIITNSNSGETQSVLFSDIVSYRHSTYNSDDILRFKLRGSSRLKLVISGFFHGSQETKFAAMVNAFEDALAKQGDYLNQSIGLREKTLFEKPISTILLFPFAVLMLWVSWTQMHSHRHVSGSLFSAWGIFVAYSVAWFAAAKRRNQQPE